MHHGSDKLFSLPLWYQIGNPRFCLLIYERCKYISIHGRHPGDGYDVRDEKFCNIVRTL